MQTVFTNDLERLRLESLHSLEIFDTDPEPAYDQLTKLACDLFQTPIALICLIGQDRVWFKSRVGLSLTEIRRDGPFCDSVVSDGEVLVLADATKDVRMSQSVLVSGDIQARFYAAAPIWHNETIIGTLCIIDRIPRTDFDAASAERLRQLAALVSSILAMRAQRNLTLIRLKAQDDAQKKLDMTEAVSGVGYWHYNIKAKALTWSKGAYDIHGVDALSYQPDVASAIAWYHPADQDTVIELARQAIAEGIDFKFELRLQRQDGEERKVYNLGTVTRDAEGNPESIFGILTDVTEHHKVQARILESESKYQLLADRSQDIIAVYDIEGMISYVSPSLKSVLGLDPADAIGRSAEQVVLEDDLAKTRHAFKNIVEQKTWHAPVKVRYRARHADGHVLWLESHPSPILDAAGTRIVSFQDVIRDVTAQVISQEQIEQSEARYRLLAENANDLVLKCDIGGYVKYASPSSARMTGIAPEDLCGKRWCDLVHPDDAERIPAVIKSLAAKGALRAPEPLEYRFLHQDGRERRFEGRPTLVYDPDSGQASGFVTIIRDVTDSTIAREKLEASEAHLRLLADNIPGMVGYWDADLNCRFANNLYEKWFGKATRDIIGASVHDVMEPEFYAENAPYFRRALDGKRQSFERSRVTPSGERGYFWVQYIPDRNLNGTVKGFYVLATDVTDMKLKELALQMSNEQLVEARKLAEAAADAKAEFLATMSHEIRTPLTTILGYANLLAESGGLSDEAETFVKRIGKAGYTLLGLVNDVLDISRLDARQLVLSPVATPIHAFARDIVDQFQMPAEANRCQLSLNCDIGLPDWLLLDDTRLA